LRTGSIDARDRKKAQREAALARRGELSDEAREHAARFVRDRVMEFDMPADAVVSGFLPIHSEIDPRPALEALRTRGHSIVLPVIVGRRAIEFRLWSEGSRLVECGFGTYGPGPEAPVMNPEVLLVPLAVFDAAGNRIGYGAGYYDAAFARLEKTGPVLKIGLAYAVQEADEVPVEAHDVPLDFIVTEKGVLDIRGGREGTAIA